MTLATATTTELVCELGSRNTVTMILFLKDSPLPNEDSIGIWGFPELDSVPVIHLAALSHLLISGHRLIDRIMSARSVRPTENPNSEESCG